ncbi:MAG: hypothetical protein ACXWL2_01485 [Candidatus Chromulinivorax sp.]
MKHYKKILACTLLIAHIALFSYQNTCHQDYSNLNQRISNEYFYRSSNSGIMLFTFGVLAIYIAQSNNTEHKATADSLKKHPYADKNLIIRAYNEKNRNLLSNNNDKFAYDDLIKENTRKNCTNQTITSIYEDNEYSINWAKIGTFEFLTRK